MKTQNKPNRKKNIKFTFRSTKEEALKIRNLIDSTGQTQQSYLLNSALGTKILDANDKNLLKSQSDFLRDMDKQLRGMGTNLNQMAHVANAEGNLPLESNLKNIAKQVSAFRQEVNDIWRSTRQSIQEQNHTQQ